MVLSNLPTLTQKQQVTLFHQVAKAYLDHDLLSDESLGQKVRQTLVPLFHANEQTPIPFILGSSVFLGRYELDLSTRPQMLRLFTLFLDQPDKFLQRDDVLERLYGVDIETLSPRLLCSLRNNLVKLVSRARACANESLGYSYGVQEWFVHDYKTRSWRLFRRANTAASQVRVG